jgi:molybdopterin molybdotransferase
MQAATLITPRLAEEAIYSRLTCLPIESLPLTQCVGGTLRENVYAERDAPPFDRVSMDGMAVDSEALRRGLLAATTSYPLSRSMLRMGSRRSTRWS